MALITLAGPVLAGCAPSGSGAATPAAAQPAKPVVLAVVGDIACEPDTPENTANPAAVKCGAPGLGGFVAQAATARQIQDMQPDAVALVGDEQYQVGKLSDFVNSFDTTYGPFKPLHRPAPGNHEYYPYTKHGDNEPGQNGAGYFGYYNGLDVNGDIRKQGQAGEYNKGWYSYDLGGWHIVSLNAECNSDAFGHNCDPTSGLLAEQTRWLEQDLAANRSRCTLAYWHQPVFTAIGDHATAADKAHYASDEGAAAATWWKLLYDHGADLVMAGHEHVYARFQPLDAEGKVDPERGLTQFIVGTGGEDLQPLLTGRALTEAHVVTAQDKAYGVLKLVLRPDGYDWAYQPVSADSGASPAVLDYRDTGTGRCHGGSAPTG